jgi:protein phosphatase
MAVTGRLFSAPALVLELPDPSLIVLVGAAGSGKSTLAARLFAPDQILSSDAYRGIVSGDESDQSVTRVAFSILHRELDRRLAAHRTTVIDATNVHGHDRRQLLRRAAAHAIPAIAIVLDLDPTLVQARNATRAGRIVPSDAVERQLASLVRCLRGNHLTTEGFAAIHHLTSPTEVDLTTVTFVASR